MVWYRNSCELIYCSHEIIHANNVIRVWVSFKAVKYQGCDIYTLSTDESPKHQMKHESMKHIRKDIATCKIEDVFSKIFSLLNLYYTRKEYVTMLKPVLFLLNINSIIIVNAIKAILCARHIYNANTHR